MSVIAQAVVILGGWAERLTAEGAAFVLSGDKQAAKDARAEARRSLAGAACLATAIEHGSAVVQVGKFWRVPSESGISKNYMASETVCACQAGAHGIECKHMAAAKALNIAATSSTGEGNNAGSTSGDVRAVAVSVAGAGDGGGDGLLEGSTREREAIGEQRGSSLDDRLADIRACA